MIAIITLPRCQPRLLLIAYAAAAITMMPFSPPADLPHAMPIFRCRLRFAITCQRARCRCHFFFAASLPTPLHLRHDAAIDGRHYAIDTDYADIMPLILRHDIYDAVYFTMPLRH